MNTAHHTVGKLGAVSSVGLHPTILFDGVIEFLKFLCGQRRQRYVAEIRFDLIFNHRFVRIKRALVNREDHIFIDPSVEPFPERHIRILGEVGVAVRCSLRGESKATPRFLLLIFGRAVKQPSNRRFPVFAVKFGEFFQS